MPRSIAGIVLAAGKGTRMKSERAKVLHEVFFRPMVHHVLDAAIGASVDRCAVIVGHQREAVCAALAGFNVTPVVQEEQLGTGHAVLCAEQACAGADLVLILCGDTPLIRAETLQAMLDTHCRQQSTLTLMTTVVEEPFGYGRILADAQGMVQAIVEEKDATGEQRAIREINAGIYLADRDFLFTALRQVGTDNSQGEVYLTDIVAIANRQGARVEKWCHPQAIDVLGVNSRVELAQAHATLQQRHNRTLMLTGVTFEAPATTLVGPDCPIGGDTVLHGGVRIEGGTVIGRDCRIEANCVLRGCRLGDGVTVGANSVLHGGDFPAGTIVHPLTSRSAD